MARPTRALIFAAFTTLALSWAAGSPRAADFSLTPRVQYFMVNSNGFIDVADDQDSTERAEFLFWGMTLGVRPESLKSTDFLGSVFYGVENDLKFDTGNGEVDVTRLDAEILARHSIPETALNYFYGARTIRVDEEQSLKSGTFAATGKSTADVETTWYLAELGIAFTSQLTGSGNHLVFGGVTGGIGYQKFEVTDRVTDSANSDRSGFAASADMQLGYQYIVSKGVSAHFRYRTLLLTNHHGEGDDLLVGHGPEIGLTFRF